jgi:hypothetical protein
MNLELSCEPCALSFETFGSQLVAGSSRPFIQLRVYHSLS